VSTNNPPNHRSSHRARKRFGQHFLKDENVIQQIISVLNPQPDQHIVEIGPGMGELTEHILPLVGTMDAIELDRDIIPKLKSNCLSLGKLNIHSADALKFNYCELTKTKQKLRIVGNLPYNISTPLLFRLTEQSSCIYDMYFMLQKEVVNRLAAVPGNKDYGKLTVIIQYHYQVEHLFDVSAQSFSPSPKVESAFVYLKPHQSPPVTVSNVTVFVQLVAKAFSQRRKTLRNNLIDIINADQIRRLGIDPNCRAETLTLNEFAILSNAIQ
jgi:16S rRNA (adenine1518-N6/adenine1519-N6)-dimethyltransferase